MASDTMRIKLGNPEKWGNSTGQNPVSSIYKLHLKRRKKKHIFLNVRNTLTESNV